MHSEIEVGRKEKENSLIRLLLLLLRHHISRSRARLSDPVLLFFGGVFRRATIRAHRLYKHVALLSMHSIISDD